jgi:hypothetical protein
MDICDIRSIRRDRKKYLYGSCLTKNQVIGK